MPVSDRSRSLHALGRGGGPQHARALEQRLLLQPAREPTPGGPATWRRSLGELDGRQTVGSAEAAAKTLYAPAIEAACGRKLVEDSIVVVMEPSPYDFGYQHVYLIDRHGSPLVYFGAY